MIQAVHRRLFLEETGAKRLFKVELSGQPQDYVLTLELIAR